MDHEKFMERCCTLAELGTGMVAPNPLVGCVLVHQGKIIGEGFHHEFGGPHAEVLAIASVKNPELLRDSILYVSLEPCSHHGKTPPCCDLIIEKAIPQVIVGSIDPFPQVSGMGIYKLMQAGIEVQTGILENKCQELNRRFFTFQQKKRPYIILKWAQSSDGFIDKSRTSLETEPPVKITNSLSDTLVHKFRASESAILTGTHSAMLDNPSLTVRHWSGENPLRVVIDHRLKLPESLHLFDNRVKTMVFTAMDHSDKKNIRYEIINFGDHVLAQILERLYHQEIQSLLVEGGAITLGHFIRQNLWDEALIFTSPQIISGGIRAPEISGRITAVEILDDNLLTVLRNE